VTGLEEGTDIIVEVGAVLDFVPAKVGAVLDFVPAKVGAVLDFVPAAGRLKTGILSTFNWGTEVPVKGGEGGGSRACRSGVPRTRPGTSVTLVFALKLLLCLAGAGRVSSVTTGTGLGLLEGGWDSLETEVKGRAPDRGAVGTGEKLRRRGGPPRAGPAKEPNLGLLR